MIQCLHWIMKGCIVFLSDFDGSCMWSTLSRAPFLPCTLTDTWGRTFLLPLLLMYQYRVRVWCQDNVHALAYIIYNNFCGHWIIHSLTQDYMLGQLHCLSVQPDHPPAYWCVWRSDWGCGTAQCRSHSPVFCACPESLTLAPQQDVWCCTQSTSALFWHQPSW